MHRLACDVDRRTRSDVSYGGWLEDGLQGDSSQSVSDSDAGGIDYSYGWLDQDDEEQVDSNGRAAADYFEFFRRIEVGCSFGCSAAEAGRSSRGVRQEQQGRPPRQYRDRPARVHPRRR